MKLSSYIIALAIFQMPAGTSMAQKYTSDSRSAIRSYEDAYEAFYERDYGEAEEEFLEAIEEDENFIEPHLGLAAIYRAQGRKDKEVEMYERAVAIDPAFYPMALYNLGLACYEGAQFEKGLNYFNQFRGMKGLKEEKLESATDYIARCQFAIEAMANPVDFEPVNMGPEVNTPYDDYWPALRGDEEVLYTTVRLPKNKAMTGEGNMYYQEDFFVASKSHGQWQQSVNMGPPVNTPSNEGAQSISADGQFFIFTSCQRKGGFGSCDLYYTYRANGRWAPPQNIGPPVNTQHWETQPSLSSDGRTLYFVSNRPGGQGSMDIWVTRLDASGQWGDPQNLGPQINTPKEDASPFIHPDGRTLYFASQGQIGMGGYDLFKSQLSDTGNWSPPQNLGYPINTPDDEIGLIVNTRGDLALFASDRFEGQGKDIYRFELAPEIRPRPVTYVSGEVYDQDSKEKLRAWFVVEDLESTRAVVQSWSEHGTGRFLVCLPAGHSYALNVSADGYLMHTQHFALRSDTVYIDPYELDIAMKPVRKGQVMELRNVFFEFNSDVLKDESSVELNKVVSFLKKNPSLKVEIGGHTDSVGTREYNLDLSQRRAQSVLNYLTEKGIDKARLVPKGYGFDKPLATNESEEGRAINRRTEIRILE